MQVVFTLRAIKCECLSILRIAQSFLTPQVKWVERRIWGLGWASNNSLNNIHVDMVHVTCARNTANQSTNEKKNNFGIYFTTGGGGGPTIDLYNSIIATAGTVGNRGINFASSNPGTIINNVIGGQLNINNADSNVNNLLGKTAGQIGLAAALTDEGGFSKVLAINQDGLAIDHCTTSPNFTPPTVDQRNYIEAISLTQVLTN